MTAGLAALRRHSGYLAALLIEVAAFYRHVLFQAGYIFPWDFRGVHMPLATFVAASLRRGEMPLWEPYTYCGNPIFANIQAAIFYPPVLFATAASNWFGADSLPRLLALAVAAQVFFAGGCTFVLLRRMGAQAGAAFIAATIYQMGCFFAAQAEHMGAMHGASWIPLAWLCVVELRIGFRWRWLAILSLALAMTVLAGLPQVAVAAFGSALALAIVFGLCGLARWRLWPQVLLAWCWALLLAAVQIIPTAQLTANSVAQYRAEWLKTGGGIKLGALYTLVLPNYWGSFDLAHYHGPSDITFTYLYCSILGLLLALAAILWIPDTWSRAFGLLTLGATVWMLGDSTAIGRTIFLALPVDIRIGIHPEYTLPVFALGIAVLAGCGANRFLPQRWQVAAGAIIALDLLLVSSGRPFNTMSLAVEPGTTHDALDGSVALAARLRTLTAGNPPYRYDTADAPYGWSSVGPILELPTANGCDPMAPERAIQLRLSFAPGERWGTCYQVVNAQSPVVGLANVRYLLSKSPEPLPRVAEAAGFTIYENPRVQPRFFFVPNVEPAADLAVAARLLHAVDFDPARTAIVEARLASTPRTIGNVQVVSYTPNRIRLQTHSEGEGFLVAADAWYPGWEALVDGRAVPLYIADVAFRGLSVPAGDHRVEMRFVPRILYYSAAISGIALSWIFIACMTIARPAMPLLAATAARRNPPTP